MCALVKWWPNAIPQSLVFHNFNHENVVKIIVNMSRHSLNLVKYNMVGSGGKDQFRGGLTMPAAEVLPLVRKFITHLPISLNLDANLKQNVQCHFYTRSRFQIPEPRKMDRLRNTIICCSSHPTVSGCSLCLPSTFLPFVFCFFVFCVRLFLVTTVHFFTQAAAAS